MNAIALLSGWGHQRDVRNPAAIASASRRASLSRYDHDAVPGDGEEGKTSTNDTLDKSYANANASVDGETGRPAADGSSSGIQKSSASPATKTQIDDVSLHVKPPEAEAYEELEDTVSCISTSPDVLLEGSSIYPTPPPSRTSSPTDAIDEAAQLQNGTGLRHDAKVSLSDSSKTSSQPPASASRIRGKLFQRKPSLMQTHDEVRTLPQQRGLSEKDTRAFARSFPVRCIARIYMLLRRFFALFGIRLQAIPALTSPATEAPVLATPVLNIPPSSEPEAPPPSYNQTITPHPNVLEAKQETLISKPAKWGLGNLLNRTKPSGYVKGKVGASPAAEEYASTFSDNLENSEEKKKKLREADTSVGPTPIMSDLPTRGHAQTPSMKATLAQLALSKPKLLVLDLDETLIHSTSRMHYASSAVTSSVDGRSNWNANTSGLKVRVVEVVLDGRSVIYHVYKRPWVDFFLRKVSSWYTVVIFTASLKEYADPVIDWLDQGRGMISNRLFRESCTYVNGSYVKDLSIVDKDLARVCLVDNSPISYAVDPANGIPIEGWINDPNDEALLDLLPMLDSLRFTNDVRHILALRLATTSTAVSQSAAKARRRRTSTPMSGDPAEEVAVARAVKSHSKTE